MSDLVESPLYEEVSVFAGDLSVVDSSNGEAVGVDLGESDESCVPHSPFFSCGDVAFFF
jgi:hypothetical protein